MSTTELGDSFEQAIYNLLKVEIEADRFLVKKANCKLFRRKGYYSKDRSKPIIFDLSIELYLPGATEYSIVLLFECKRYSHAVPVDDAEEFFAKVQQVASANGKAVIASTGSFQSGARAFAKSKGIGLLRYFDAKNFKWELRRSPSAGNRTTGLHATSEDEGGLAYQDFVSTVFDLYLQSPSRVTNSLWDFVEDIVLDTPLNSRERATLANPRSRLLPQVPFREKEHLESNAAEVLDQISYSDGEVPLEDICAFEAKRCQLKVQLGASLNDGNALNPILGRIRFKPVEIEVFAQPEPNKRRERFTLAHELAHHLLGHGDYMIREFCEERDFVIKRGRRAESNDIARMEFQANYFAASLLMPRNTFVEDFWLFIRMLNVRNRGFGALYVDNQACNLQPYQIITGQLMERYGVSRTASTLRLEGLGLLVDARTAAAPPASESLLVELAEQQNS